MKYSLEDIAFILMIRSSYFIDGRKRGRDEDDEPRLVIDGGREEVQEIEDSVEPNPEEDMAEPSRKRTKREHQCTLCNRNFSAKSSLKRHTKLHTDKSKKHICKSCKSDFKTRQDLVRHQDKVHIKEKVHKCDQCPKRYMSKHSLTNHIKVFHLKKKEFFCSQCRVEFSQKTSLVRHIRTKHKNEEESFVQISSS